jgi:hypothetical protein
MNQLLTRGNTRIAWWRLGLLAVAVMGILWSSVGAAAAGIPQPSSTTACRLAFYDYNVIPPGHARTSFSASLDNVAYLQSTWGNVTGSHIAHYLIYSRDGALYQDLAVPFITAHTRSTVLWGALPIAGTWMARLPGVWTVRMTLDSNATVLTTNRFTLTY